MTPEALLDELKRLHVRLDVADGVLHCRAPKGVMTAELQAQVKEHKDALTALVAQLPLTEGEAERQTPSPSVEALPVAGVSPFADPQSPALWAEVEALAAQADKAVQRGDQVKALTLDLRFRAAFLSLALLEGRPCYNAQGE